MADPLDDPFDDFEFDTDLDDGSEDTETTHAPSARAIRLQVKRRALKLERQDNLREVLGELPAAGEQIHIVARNRFDFWSWTPTLIEWLKTSDHFYCSTWGLNRNTCRDLFALCDAGKIPPAKCHIYTGTYFKRRESSVYSYLLEGLRARGGHYRAFSNHSKVLLLANARRRTWLTIETSANLTDNPRFEQYVLTNDRRLHDFHRAWMDELLAANEADPFA